MTPDSGLIFIDGSEVESEPDVIRSTIVTCRRILPYIWT